MKFRKVVSLFAAAAMAVSCFAGLSVSASAAETYSYTVPTADVKMNAGDTLISNDDVKMYINADITTATTTDSNFDSATYPNNIPFRSNSVSKHIDDVTSIVYTDGNGIVYASVVIEPSVNGTFNGEVNINTGKKINIWDNTSNTAIATVSTTAKATTPIEADLEADHQYIFWVSGTTASLAAVSFTPEEATTTPSIELSSSAETLVVDGTVELTATTENTGDNEVVWTSDDEAVATVENGLVTGVGAGNTTITAMVNVDGTEYSATCEVTVVSTATVSFTATGAEGSAPAAITANIGESITLPVNKTYYVEGSTLTGWSDGTTTYAPGESYAVENDVTLTAVFEENTAALGDAEASVTFWFGKSNGAPSMALQNKTGILVAQADINGTPVDVKLNIDTTSGKLANTSDKGDRTDQWAQCNAGTKFSVSVLAGSVVTVGDCYDNADVYTINGVEKTGDNGSETISEAGDCEIELVTSAQGYWSSISVTYPKVESGDDDSEEITSNTTVITADEMTAVGNSNGKPSTSSSASTNATDAYISNYQDIFGVDFANVTSTIYGYLGDSSRGYLETTFTTTADGACTLDVLASYGRSSNLITVTDSDGNVILDAVSPTQSEKLGTANWDLYAYTVTIDSLPAGTYTFKWHSDSYCSDFVALAVTSSGAGAESTPVPDSDATDVEVDLTYLSTKSILTADEIENKTEVSFGLDADYNRVDASSSDAVIVFNKARYHSEEHGINYGSMTVPVSGAAIIKVGTCNWGSDVTIKDASGNTIASENSDTGKCYSTDTKDDNVITMGYNGTEATTLTITGGSYLPYISVKAIDTDTISGSLVNASDLNEGTLTFTNQTTGLVYTAAISNGIYSAVVPTGAVYDVLLLSENYTAVTTYTAKGDDSSADITCEAATYKTVTGEVINAEADTLTFTGTNFGYSVTADIAAGAASYTVELMPDVYTVSSSVDGISELSKSSFLVVEDNTVKNIYYPETIPAATASTVTVYPDVAVSGTNYHTIADAVAGIKAAGLSSSTIILKSGATYCEQVRIQIDGVTLKTDGEAKATISWYYGIGYTYYSLGADGYYDKDRAMTKVGKLERDPDRWGAVVRVQGNNFKAENIIFENSFNQRFTEAEVSDGVEYNGCQSITVDRVNPTVAADSRTATERAAAIAIESTGVELYNCEFIGSQDTFFTGGTAYVKDCAITGNTDYIFGGGSIVFDNCDLIWGGYSDQEAGGYITASSTGDSDAGYIFRDCTIKDGSRVKAAGSFGRDWGGTKAHAYFINCTDATSKGVSGWSNMGGAVKAGTADLHVFDLSNPSAYATYGTSDKYNITEFTFDEAKAIYEDVLTTLSFTPDNIVTADTTAEALDGVADDTDYVYGVITKLTVGANATASKITWTIKDAGNNVYTRSTDDAIDNVNVLSKGQFPTITGGGYATVTMLFHAPEGEYEVFSQAE